MSLGFHCYDDTEINKSPQLDITDYTNGKSHPTFGACHGSLKSYQGNGTDLVSAIH